MIAVCSQELRSTTLESCYSKCVLGPAASASLGAYWKCRISGPTPNLLNWNLHLDTVPKGIMCTLKLEKRWSKLVIFNWE